MNNQTIKHNTAGLVVIKNNQVLLIFRKWRFAPEGTYILPKGHVEEGESNLEGAIREVIEETGYNSFKILTELPSVTINYQDPKDNSDHEKTIFWYLAELENESKIQNMLTDSELESKDFSLEWIDLNRSIELCKFDTEKITLQNTINYMTNIEK
jgi:8-oxo-dGTP pyrophosphatase MutT (NUDIX family)